METERGKIADRSQFAPLVRAAERLRGIFDDQQAMARGDVHDHIHFARHAGVMHRNNRLGPRGYRRFDQPFVNIQCVRANIDEDRRPPRNTTAFAVDTKV